MSYPYIIDAGTMVGGTSSNPSVTISPVAIAGDLLVAWLFQGLQAGGTYGSGPTIPSGFTSLLAVGWGVSQFNIAYKIAAGGEGGSVIWTNGTTVQPMWICGLSRFGNAAAPYSVVNGYDYWSQTSTLNPVCPNPPDTTSSGVVGGNKYSESLGFQIGFYMDPAGFGDCGRWSMNFGVGSGEQQGYALKQYVYDSGNGICSASTGTFNLSCSCKGESATLINASTIRSLEGFGPGNPDCEAAIYAISIPSAKPSQLGMML